MGDANCDFPIATVCVCVCVSEPPLKKEAQPRQESPGGGLAQPPPRGLPRATALKKGGCQCVVRIDLCTCLHVACYAVSMSCLVLVCYAFFRNYKEPAKRWATMFLRSLSYFLLCVMLACVGRFPGRDEPWLIRCPGPHHVTSEIRGGPWAPPPRMCRHNSSVQIVLLCLVLVWLRSGVRLCSERSGEKTLLFEFWPFKFRSLLGCFFRSGVWGPPWGCAVSTTFFFRATGGPTDDRL